MTNVIKPSPYYGPIRCFIIRPLSIPMTSSPFLALPSLQASNTFSMLLLHMLFPLPAKLKFLYGLIQIPVLPLELKLSQPYHSVCHIPCPVFLYNTEVLSLISSATIMGFSVRYTWNRILSPCLLWPWTNCMPEPFSLHFFIGKSEWLYSWDGITCQVSEFSALLH